MHLHWVGIQPAWRGPGPLQLFQGIMPHHPHTLPLPRGTLNNCDNWWVEASFFPTPEACLEGEGGALLTCTSLSIPLPSTYLI